MYEWQEMFESEIGMPFPTEMLPDVSLAPVLGGKMGQLLVGSPPAVELPYVDQGTIDEFIESAPDGYFMAGYWGHGINSYAFYYVVADAWRRVFLRLPYGLAYDKNEEMADLIRRFLPRYREFEDRLRDQAESLLFVESMGSGCYRVVLKDGRSLEHSGSLFFEPDQFQLPDL